MRVTTKIAVRIIVLSVIAAALVLSGNSGAPMPAHPQLVSNPPSCC
jgi:hypothetical protein